jgi:hypothetical protein
MVLTADGKGVPMRREGGCDKPVRLKKGQKANRKRQACVGGVYLSFQRYCDDHSRIHDYHHGVISSHGEEALLHDCYWNSMDLAHKQGLTSIAFPCISTGIYGYPADQAARIAVKTVRDYQAQMKCSMDVLFCCFSDEDEARYRALIRSETLPSTDFQG